MTTVYVIIGGRGEYSDRTTWPELVFLDQVKAQSVMAKLEAIAKPFKEDSERPPRVRSTLPKDAKSKALAAYEALGCHSMTIHVVSDTDWEMAEAILVP